MKARKYVTATAALLLVCATTLTGCSYINKGATLATMTIGDEKETITLGYGNFVAKYNQSLYDQTYISYFGEEMWSQDMYGNGNTFEDDVKSDVLTQIENGYISRAHASEYDIELTEDEQKAIDKAAKKFMEDNSEDAIKQMGATEEYVSTMLTLETYSQKLEDAIKAEADDSVTEDEAAQRTFTYVKLDTQSTYDENYNEVALTEEDVAKLKEQADTLAASADFDATVESLGVSAQTYSYGADEDYSTMKEEVIKAADALKAGEVSPVIEVADDGYYVLRLDSEYDEEATQTKMTSLAEEKRTDYYNEVMDGWKKDDNWTVDEKKWAKVTFKDLFERVETEDTTTDDAEDTSGDTTTDATEETTGDTTTDDAEDTTQE